MILSDREIRAALGRNAIRITPDPTLEPSMWSSTALDLRLGDRLACWDFSRAGAPSCFSPGDPDHNLLDLVARFTHSQVIPESGLALAPGSFYLGWTQEAIQLPYRSRIAARVEGKSSLARLGLDSMSRLRRFMPDSGLVTPIPPGLAIPSSSRSGTPARFQSS